MKVLFFIGSFPLPSETFILNQITGLIDRGHDVYVFATKRADVSGIVHADIEKYDLLNRTHFRQKDGGNPITRRLRRLWTISALMGTNPALVLRAVCVRRLSKDHSIATILSDIDVTKNFPAFDIIHCHFGFHGNRAMLLREVGALSGKLVTTFHAADLTFKLDDWGGHYYRNLFDRGDLFLPISKYWQQRLVELGCIPGKIKVHRMGIDCTRRLLFRERKPQPNEKIKIVSIARLTEKKGLEYGIKAVAHLKKINPNIEYLIVGDGPLRPQLKQLVIDLDVRDCVKLMGWQEQQEVVKTLKNSTIFMAPSITASNGDKEGIPVVLMEAMAMGMPVISTNHSGIPELVENGRSGFLVPEKDVDALFKKLKYVIEHPHMWSDMGRHGRKKVEAEYNINVLNDKLVECFQSLID